MAGEQQLSGQVAFVSGGGLLLALASAGASVAIADIIPERCAEVVERIAELGARSLECPLDVTDT